MGNTDFYALRPMARKAIAVGSDLSRYLTKKTGRLVGVMQGYRSDPDGSTTFAAFFVWRVQPGDPAARGDEKTAEISAALTDLGYRLQRSANGLEYRWTLLEGRSAVGASGELHTPFFRFAYVASVVDGKPAPEWPDGFRDVWRYLDVANRLAALEMRTSNRNR